MTTVAAKLRFSARLLYFQYQGSPVRWRACDRDRVRLPLHRRAHQTHDLGEAHVALEAVAAAPLHPHGAACLHHDRPHETPLTC